jgi:hypothetical protein
MVRTIDEKGERVSLRNQKCPFSERGGERGSILLGVVFASVLVLFSLFVFNTVIRSSTRGLQSLETGQDIIDIQNWVVQNMSCANTVGWPGNLPAECSGTGNFMRVIDPYGNTLIDEPHGSDYTEIGRGYLIRAQCAPCGGDDVSCGSSGWKLSVQVKRTVVLSQMLRRLDQWSDIFGAEYQRTHPMPCQVVSGPIQRLPDSSGQTPIISAAGSGNGGGQPGGNGSGNGNEQPGDSGERG